MIRLKENYYALKKCVIDDYPYQIEWDDALAFPVFERVYRQIIAEHSNINDRYFSRDGKGMIMLNFQDHYVILCYRYANALWKENLEVYSEYIYYSMRSRCSIDLFYRTEIGAYFLPNHALGTVIDSHARYGKLLFVMNDVHIGPYNITGTSPDQQNHPVIGDYVTLCSKCSIFGKTVIGNNVVVANNTLIMNEEIPDNCIVYGQSPNLYFVPLKTKNSDKLFHIVNIEV